MRLLRKPDLFTFRNDPVQHPRRERFSSPAEKAWQAWDADRKNPDLLLAVVSALDPVVQRRVGQLAGGHAPPNAMLAFGRAKVAKAIGRWDPNHIPPASLETFVQREIGNLTDDLDRYKMSEVRFKGKRSRLVGPLRSSQDALRSDLGREPTVDELIADMAPFSIDAATVGLVRTSYENLRGELGRAPALEEMVDRSGVPPDVVSQLRRMEQAQFGKLTGLIKDVPLTLDELRGGNSGFSTELDPFVRNRFTPAQVQMMRTVRQDLDPTERVVWDLHLGINGQPLTPKNSDKAKAVGRSNSYITRTLERIQGLLEATGWNEGR